MSIKWAVVETTNGEVLGVHSLSSTRYTDGEEYESGYIIKNMSSVSNPESYIDEKYWTGSAWADKAIKTGEYYKFVDGSWILDSDRLWDEIRRLRTNDLEASDWAVVLDSPLSTSQLTEVKSYRTALRNIPQNAASDVNHPDDIVWPTPPSFIA